MLLSERKHEDILKAAIEVFLEAGFDHARVDDIAKRASVSKRTVYRHFESKTVLFDAMVERVKKKFNTVYEVAFEADRPIEAQLQDIARAEGKLFTSKFFMQVAGLLWSEMSRSPELATRMPAREDHARTLTKFMQAAMNAGALRQDDPARAVERFVGPLKAQAFWPQLHSGETLTQAEMDNVVEDSVEFFLSHYAPTRA